MLAIASTYLWSHLPSAPPPPLLFLGLFYNLGYGLELIILLPPHPSAVIASLHYHTNQGLLVPIPRGHLSALSR